MSLSREALPLILVTNDDGIYSPGLRAAAAALRPFGELLIAAPLHQHSGSGRSFSYGSKGAIHRVQIELDGEATEAFGIEATPAQTVVYALIELAPRLPDLTVVGINYGENVGQGITVSGTVGAALESASAGIPALAVSLETAPEYYFSHSLEIDFGAAAHFAQLFVQRLISTGFQLELDVDVLKIDVPQNATPGTPWRLTRVSRLPYYEAIRPERKNLSDPHRLAYRVRTDWSSLEPDSDIHALVRDRVVSVSPLSLDLSSRVDARSLERALVGP